METSILKCPVCNECLIRDNRAYVCSNRHSFDIARSGYINLLQNCAPGRHGDDKLMVRSRSEFLNHGYYDPLVDLVSSWIAEMSSEMPVVIDAGCGEGKYSAAVLKALYSLGKKPSFIGVDISKAAAEALAKRTKDIMAVVASTSNMPIKDNSADLLLNLFSPFFREEFLRVLKPHGRVLRVVPLENHLWELKQAIYDTPYKNEVPAYEEQGLNVVEKREIRYRVTIPNSEDLKALFQMTPYFYKTSEKDQKKLELVQSLDISIEFLLILYEKGD